MPSSSGKISDFPVSNGKQHGISQHESTNKIELNDDEKQELIVCSDNSDFFIFLLLILNLFYFVVNFYYKPWKT